MYLHFFSLKMKPFDLQPNPDFLFLSKSHKKAMTYLDYSVKNRSGFILLSGEIGSGKTTVIRDLFNKYRHNMVFSKISNTAVDFQQLLVMINEDFGLKVVTTEKLALLRQLNDFLVKQYAQGKQTLLIIDEVQNLSPATLEELRLLSNLETDNAKLLHIVMVGQPEIQQKLALPELLQLRQRISCFCHLLPLEKDEISPYILHRLECAGNRHAVDFSAEALELIWKHSRGIPRLINILCDFLLLLAFAEEKRTISEDLVTTVLNDLNFEACYWGKPDNHGTSLSQGTGLKPASHKVHSHTASGIKRRRSQVRSDLSSHTHAAVPATPPVSPVIPKEKKRGLFGFLFRAA